MTESKKNVASKHTKRNVEWRSEGTTSKYAEVNLFLSLADFESWRFCRAFDNCELFIAGYCVDLTVNLFEFVVL